MNSSQVVANLVLDEAAELDRLEESAAAYFTVRVEPGIYQVELKSDRHGSPYLVANFAGIVVRSGYGSKRYDSETGKPGTVARLPYAYELRSGKLGIGRKAECRVEILDAGAIEAYSAGGAL